MPTTALIGAALQGTNVYAYGLYVGGNNVLLEPGIGGNRFGVPQDTITVTEAGFGGVSSMTFTLEDPTIENTISIGDDVLYLKHSETLPEFRGWVQRWTVKPWGIGRMIEIECIGVEALLDWMIIPSLTITAGAYGGGPPGSVGELVQRVVNAAVGPGVPLNIAVDAANSGGQLTKPIGGGGLATNLASDLVITGQTLREGLRMLSDALYSPAAGVPQWGIFTIDYLFGLRWIVLERAFPDRIPVDYDDLTITDTTAGPIIGAGPSHEVDSASVTRAVYVKGGNANGTGLVTDGSGKVGAFAILEDAAILTNAARDAAGLAYLRDKSFSVRGDVTRQTFIDPSTVTDHVQALSNVVFTDAQLSLSGVTYRIAQIEKHYHGANLETWTISYGGMPPSFPNAVRRLTRDVLS